MKQSCFFLVTAFFTVVVSGLAFSDQWTTYTKESSGLCDNEVRAICVDSFGVKWFGTKNGLSSYNGNSWKNYTTDDKLAHNTVNAIAFETTSYGPEIWVATNGGVSVVSVKPDAVTFATPYRKDTTGLISDIVYCAAVDTGHVKFFGTEEGVSAFSGSEWKSYTVENMLNGIVNIVTAVFASSEGMVYLGSEGSGVTRFDGVTSATPYDAFYSKIASDYVYAIYIGHDGSQWFGTDSGLSRHTGTSITINWTTFTVDDGLAGNFINAIACDAKGVIWAGCDGGVSSFDGSVWKKYTKQDGLAGDNVFAIAVDPDGSLWFGAESGVSHFIEGSVVVEDNTGMPNEFAIRGSYPNPFNPQASIEYVLPSDGFAELTLFNQSGQKVRRLVNADRSAGLHTAVWDGCDDNGQRVSSGMYFPRLKMGNRTTSGRMMLIK